MLAGVKSRTIISRDFRAVQSVPDTRLFGKDDGKLNYEKHGTAMQKSSGADA
jgi:hypothetical protein